MVDSKAIAVVIIGVGIMVLIVSAAIGAPANIVHTFSGWPAQAHILTVMPILAATPCRWRETDVAADHA